MLILPSDTKVNSLSYAESKHITVEEIHLTMPTSTGIIHVHKSDIVLITLGSMTSSSTLGTNHTAPSSATSPANLSTDGSWKLWESLSNDSPNFGHPANFSTRVPESHWQSFTVTLKSPELLTRLAEFTHNAPGTGALTTFADSNWLLSIVVPHQPHFLSQPPDVQVFWGYGLYPSRTGNFVTKPMTECSGEEILTELLSHLHFSPIQPYLDAAITIPCSMPYITSQFLTRGPGDRPQVIPLGSTNLAFMGQFVEIPLDVVFTVEYSVRGALMAVAGLMGLEKRPRGVYKGDHDPRVMIKVLKAMIEDGLGGCGPTRSSDRGGDSVDRKVDVPLGFPVFI
jgi:oleate hydratase